MAELKRMPEKFKRLSARLKRLSEHKRINIELSIERSEGGVCLPVPGQNAIQVKRHLLLMSGAVLEGCASPKFHLAENGLT
jgi:hypothetical protein